MSEGKRGNLLRIVLLWQGLYYGASAVWALAALDSFSRVSGHEGNPFEMHAISALSLVLALVFIMGAVLEKYRLFAGWLLLGAALAVIGPEVAHFSMIEGSLFVADLIEEIAVALATSYALLRHK